MIFIEKVLCLFSPTHYFKTATCVHAIDGGERLEEAQCFRYVMQSGSEQFHFNATLDYGSAKGIVDHAPVPAHALFRPSILVLTAPVDCTQS